MFSNVQLKPTRISPWRKSAIATWRTAYDPSVYGSLTIEAAPLQKVIEEYRAKGVHLTMTHIVTKALAIALHEIPEINAILRMGSLSYRKEINIFLQTATDEKGDDLSGFVIYNADQKSLREIAEETKNKASEIRDKKDPTFSRMKKMFSLFPPFIIHWMMRFSSFLTYDLNINSKFLGLPRDVMGCAMVTSVGMLGLQEGFAPLVPYSRVPILIMLGQIHDKALVKGDQIVPGRVFNLCCTFDHRIADGVHMAKAVTVLKKYLDNPY